MSEQGTFGRLVPIDVRHAWGGESSHFTPWLAQETNLELLGNAIDLDLELVAQEQPVGPFRADIVCRDTADGHYVLIENQLEKTDHTHLGQLLTYAAGLEAVSIVWIARRFTDEHRAALDWLNNVTTERLNFFGLEIELWQIDSSPYAPKFNVVCRPNDWTKPIARATTGLTELNLIQIEYYTKLNERIRETGSFLKTRKPLPQNWMDFAIGTSEFHLVVTLNSVQKNVSVSLYISGSDKQEHYQALWASKEEIERSIGEPLAWWKLPEKKSSYISLYLRQADLKDTSDWDRQHGWIIEKLQLFYTVFRPYVMSMRTTETAVGEEPVEES